MNCEQCGIEYGSKRATSRYCSGACRAKADRLSARAEPTELSARNSLAIPGDPDYVGCCKLVDEVWVVDNTKPPVKDMSNDELIRRLHYINADWRRSPEHKEVLRRRTA